MISLITISCEQAYYIDAPAHPDKEKIITIINEQRSKGANVVMIIIPLQILLNETKPWNWLQKIIVRTWIEKTILTI